MTRYEELRDLFLRRRCFKLVCGAGNESEDEVNKLAMVYTLAGASILDISANVKIVEAAKNGIEEAYKLAPTIGKKIEIRPFLHVSIGMEGDPHVRKSSIDMANCVKCGECAKTCPQNAINCDYVVAEYKCIGCGKCNDVCNFEAVRFYHKKADFNNVLPACKKEGVELMELHAVTEDYNGAMADWKLLNEIIDTNFVSMCLDRFLLSNTHFIERVKAASEITGERLIVQTDGAPMSGGDDDFNTTLQAVACADIMQKSGIPAMIVISGGTNSKTGILARQCGVAANGVALGSYARKIVKTLINNEDFSGNIDNIRAAVKIAEGLVTSNIEAMNG